MTVRELVLTPFMICPLLAYKTSTYKDRIEKDVDRFWTIHYGRKPSNYAIGIIREIANCIEFRNLFFYRCGRVGRILSHLSLFFLPTQKLLFFGVDRSRFMGGIYSAWLLYGHHCRIYRRELLGEIYHTCYLRILSDFF